MFTGQRPQSSVPLTPPPPNQAKPTLLLERDKEPLDVPRACQPCQAPWGAQGCDKAESAAAHCLLQKKATDGLPSLWSEGPGMARPLQLGQSLPSSPQSIQPIRHQALLADLFILIAPGLFQPSLQPFWAVPTSPNCSHCLWPSSSLCHLPCQHQTDLNETQEASV